jgi:hypothetical protein
MARKIGTSFSRSRPNPPQTTQLVLNTREPGLRHPVRILSSRSARPAGHCARWQRTHYPFPHSLACSYRKMAARCASRGIDAYSACARHAATSSKVCGDVGDVWYGKCAACARHAATSSNMVAVIGEGFILSINCWSQ